MRLNALISISLALALSSTGQLSLAATSHSGHRTAVHNTAAPTAKHRTAKRNDGGTAATTKRVAGPAATERKTTKRGSDAVAPSATVERVRSSSRSRRGRKSGPGSARASARVEGHRRKATSQDFLDAAGAVVAKNGRPSRAQSADAASPSAVGESGEKLAEVRASDVAGSNQPATPSASSVTRAASVNPRLGTVEEEAATPVILPTLYNKRGRLIVPPPLRGSHEILVRQNRVADRDGLDRIQDDADLTRMRAAHLLVPLPVSSALDVDDRLPANRRYTRPWTEQFLITLSRAHYARFHTPLQVNSAVRTVEFQQRLQRTNGNAAPSEGETASPHLTGQAVDLAKHGLSLTEIAWLRGYLLPLSQQGRIDVEEEFQQACFHISVYKKYLPATPRREIAAGRHSETTALAAGIN